jgi:N-acetylmuramoyl-L-alanine amidase
LSSDRRRTIDERRSRINTSIVLSVFIGICLGLVFPAFAEARSIQVGRKIIETTEINDIEYVSVGKITAALNGQIWQFDDKWIVSVPLDSTQNGQGKNGNKKKECEIVFKVKSDTIIVDHRPVQSPFPIQMVGNDAFVPVFILGEVFPLPKVTVPNIIAMDITQIKDTTVLNIEVDTSVIYETEVLSSLEYQLYLQALTDIKEVKPKGIIKNVILGSKSGTLLALFFDKPCDQKVKKTAKGISLKCYARPQKKISTIVLDPGHGGKDPGAEGRIGLKEKLANLGIALRLKKRLETIGIRVLVTREDDRYVSLADRVQFAKFANADLFVSVHCNAGVRDRKKHGLETYFLSDAKTDWERAVAARENAAVQFEVNDTNPITNNDLSLILSDLAQNEFLSESQQLAGNIQEATAATCRMSNRGVMQANFYVLRVNFMPAVLVECGYVSNTAEEKLLLKKDYWEKVASGIFNGIKRFVTEYEKKYAQP